LGNIIGLEKNPSLYVRDFFLERDTGILFLCRSQRAFGAGSLLTQSRGCPKSKSICFLSIPFDSRDDSLKRNHPTQKG
jgi:hypothetical protein